ncbi:MAG: uracil-DNA glycosylase [Rickettsiales bacterium]|jgi:DNA polymerase|nr:uracil-DNA glycosylase [Rickettsiales bacterium]
MYEELEEIRAKCLVCTKCGLCRTRKNVVFSDGVPNPKLALIGEAPGASEDEQGKPFVGKSGQLLDKIFASVGLGRANHIYICNTVKCRPPENRNPDPSEKEACREYLDAQLRVLEPRLILLCGSVAVQSMLPEVQGGITRIRGRWFDGPYGARMMPIFHPAYLLRNESTEKGSPKWFMWQDVQEIKRAYDELV